MYDLSLFPLNMVLFPGTPAQLHIFEERYKRMIADCLRLGHPFGVVLIHHGQEAGGVLPEPQAVGCTAQIVHVQRLDGGRMNITVLGGERFRILAVDHVSQPYLVGSVENLLLSDPDPTRTQALAVRLRDQLDEYLKRLVDAGLGQLTIQHMPLEPASLAYMAAALLQMELEQKQAILNVMDRVGLLSNLVKHYQRELVLLDSMLKDGALQIGGFSVN